MKKIEQHHITDFSDGESNKGEEETTFQRSMHQDRSQFCTSHLNRQLEMLAKQVKLTNNGMIHILLEISNNLQKQRLPLQQIKQLKRNSQFVRSIVSQTEQNICQIENKEQSKTYSVWHHIKKQKRLLSTLGLK